MNDELYEKAWEAVQENPLGALIRSKSYTEDFLDWLDTYHHEAFQAMLNEWLETVDGKAFFESAVERLVNDRPEPDREQLEDR